MFHFCVFLCELEKHDWTRLLQLENTPRRDKRFCMQHLLETAHMTRHGVRQGDKDRFKQQTKQLYFGR